MATSSSGSPNDGTRSDSFSDSVWGFGDLIPQAALRWNNGVHNWMTYITGDIPVGAYDSTRLSNIGIGHGAIDAGGGYTYFNPQTGQPSSCSRCAKAATHGLQADGVPAPKNPMVGSLPACCARAASGHATAAPPSSVMNSRRFITRSPRRRGRSAARSKGRTCPAYAMQRYLL